MADPTATTGSKTPSEPDPTNESAEVTTRPLTPEQPLLIPPQIAAALVKLQSEVKTIIKGAKNEHFGNTYAELKDVQEMALPLLSKHGLALTQWPVSRGDKFYLRSYLVHESGVGMADDIELMLTKRDAQGLGSTITYTRRQTTMAYLGLSAEDDDDGNKAANRQTKPTAEQISEVRQLCIDLKYPPDQAEARIVSLRTEDQATVAIANLRKNVSERASQIRGDNEATPVFTGSHDQVVPIAVTNKAKARQGIVDDSAIANVSEHMLELPINAKAKRGLVSYVVNKPFLKNCTPEEVTKIAEVVDQIKNGTYDIPADWLESDIAPPVETA